MPDPKDWTPILSPEKIAEYREIAGFGAHLGVGGKALREILDSHEALRVSADRRARKGVFGLTETQWIDNVIRAVSELPDYTSPDDQPNVMMCTAEELRDILTDQIPDLQTIGSYDAPSDSRAPREGTIASDSQLAAILHQLELGEASTGDVRDVAWCAKELRAYIEAEVSGAPREGKPVASLTDEQVIDLAGEIGNVALDCSRQWGELDSAREGLPGSERVHEDAENKRIIHGHANRFRALFEKYTAPPVSQPEPSA